MNSVICEIPEFKVKTVYPSFEIVRAIPEGMGDQITRAVVDFIDCSNLPAGIDRQGFYHQTLQAIANSAILGQGSDLWLGMVNKELWIYLLGHVGPDFDGRMSYTVTQAWVKPDQRGQRWVKWAWGKVRQRAKDCLCSHFAVISTKENDAAYCRFLGKGFKKYATILKEDL